MSAQTIAVYAYLWESAYWAQNLDRAGREFWSDRRDTGGTSHWSIDGLAKQLHIGHTTAEKAINILINHGFIRVLNSYQQGRERKRDTFKSSILLKLTMSESHLRSLKSLTGYVHTKQ